MFKTFKSSEDPLCQYSTHIVVWSLYRYCMKTTPNRLCHSLAPTQLQGSIKSVDNQYFITVATNSQTQAIYYAYFTFKRDNSLSSGFTSLKAFSNFHQTRSQTSLQTIQLLKFHIILWPLKCSFHLTFNITYTS